MTEEKSKNELEKMTTKLQVVAMIGVGLMVFGGGIGLWSVMSWDYKMVPDNEHITDQGMPIRDLKNATYTWTSEEIADMAKERTGILTVGGFILIPGVALFYGTLFTIPSKRKLHEIGCVPNINIHDDDKYCSECGLKLEKKG